MSYKVPFGASLRYLIELSAPAPTVVGALQFSSAAWRLHARDARIGWDDATRARHLQTLAEGLPIASGVVEGRVVIWCRTG